MSERDVDIVDLESDRRCCGLLSMGPVVRKLVGAEFGMGEVKLKYLCEG